MRKFLTALFCLGFVAAPTVASACMPPPDYRERWQEYEDQDLLRATVLFRGVIEDLQEPEGRYGDVTMVIRRTQSFWGRGAPERIVISREYFSNCARGNLHAAVDGFGEFPGLPVVQNGLGVTMLGRAEDASAPWDFVILVDDAPDTQRVLRRFKELERPDEPEGSANACFSPLSELRFTTRCGPMHFPLSDCHGQRGRNSVRYGH